MTRDQTTVLWLGLILIALNIIVHIAEVKSVIFGGASKQVAKPAAPKTSGPPLAPGPLSPGSNLGNPPGSPIVV